MTVAMLMENTVRSATKAAFNLLKKSWELAPLTLRPARPVPRCIFFLIYTQLKLLII